MKLKLLILIVFLFVVSSSQSFAQLTDYNFLGGGARAKAMGGAFFGVSDDPSAASWNPAGLTQLDKYQMVLTFNNNRCKTSFDQTLKSGGESKPISDLSDDVKNLITFSSVVIPFKIYDQKLVASVLYNRISDVGGEHLFYTNNYLIAEQKDIIYNQNGDPIKTFTISSRMHELYRIYQLLTFPISGVYGDFGFVGDFIGYDREKYELDVTDFKLKQEIDGGLDKISLALGGSPLFNLSLGLAVNIYTGGYTLQGDHYGFIIYDIEKGAPDTTTYLDLKPVIEADYSGFNFTFGAMYQMNNFRIGGVIKTPYTLKEEQDVRLEWDERAWNENEKKWEINPGRTSRRGLYLPQEYAQEWKFPLAWGIGASYKIQNLTLAGDFEMTYYSKTELSYPKSPNGSGFEEQYWAGDFNPPENPALPDRTVKLLWNDVSQLRLGAEYIFSTEYGKIPIRIGYRNDPKPYTSVENVDIDTMIFATPEDTLASPRYIYKGDKGDKINGNVFTFGTGIGWSQILFDITYEYSQYEIKSTGKSVALPKIEGIKYDDFDEVVERKDHKIMIGFTGFF